MEGVKRVRKNEGIHLDSEQTQVDRESSEKNSIPEQKQSNEESSDDDAFYFRSQKSSDVCRPISPKLKEACIPLELPDNPALIPEQKTPVKQIQSWADVDIPPQTLNKPSDHAKQALTFEKKDENDNIHGEDRDAPADEGVYDCEPSTSQTLEDQAAKPKQGTVWFW